MPFQQEEFILSFVAFQKKKKNPTNKQCSISDVLEMLCMFVCFSFELLTLRASTLHWQLPASWLQLLCSVGDSVLSLPNKGTEFLSKSPPPSRSM